MAEGSDTPEQEVRPSEKTESKFTRRQFLKGLAGVAALGGLAAVGSSCQQEQSKQPEQEFPSYLKDALVLVRDVQGGRVRLDNNGAEFNAPNKEDQGFITVSKNNHREQEELRLSPDKLIDKWVDSSIPVSTIRLVVREKINETQGQDWQLHVFNDKSYVIAQESPYYPIAGQTPKSHVSYITYFNPATEQPVGYTVARYIYGVDKIGKETLDYHLQKGQGEYPTDINTQKPLIPKDVQTRMGVLVQGLAQQVKK